MDQFNDSLQLARNMETIKLLLVVIALALICITPILALLLNHRRAEQKERNEQKAAEVKAREEERKAQSARETMMLGLYDKNIVVIDKLTSAIESNTLSSQKRNAIDEEQQKTLEAHTTAINTVVTRANEGIAKLEQNTQAVDALRGENTKAHDDHARKLAAIEEISKRVDALPDQVVDGLQKQITPIFKEVMEISEGIQALLKNGKAQADLAEKLGQRLEGIETKLITFVEKVAPSPTAMQLAAASASEAKPSPEAPGMAPIN